MTTVGSASPHPIAKYAKLKSQAVSGIFAAEVQEVQHPLRAFPVGHSAPFGDFPSNATNGGSLHGKCCCGMVRLKGMEHEQISKGWPYPPPIPIPSSLEGEENEEGHHEPEEGDGLREDEAQQCVAEEQPK